MTEFSLVVTINKCGQHEIFLQKSDRKGQFGRFVDIGGGLTLGYGSDT